MGGKSCFLIGYREASEEIYQALYAAVEQSIPTPDGFDGTFYTPGMERVPRKIAIVRANRCIMDHVDYLIA